MILVIVILRIIVGWDSNCVDVMVMEQMDQVVHCFVKPLNGDKSFHCSFIYAYSHTTYRRSLWKSLKKYKRAITNEPWIVFGDFNASFHPFEKSTGGSMITTSMSDFRDCVTDVEIEDIAMTGLRFTWNKQPGKADHSLAVFVIPEVDKAKPKPFKFHNFLTRKEGFLPLVNDIWKTYFKGFSMYFVVSRLKLLKKPLRKFNRDKGNLFENVKDLKSELTKNQTAMVEDPFSSSLHKAELNCLKAYRVALIDEESFLRQKSKSVWLKEVDINSKYFHDVIRGRLNRGRISMVEDIKGKQFVGSKSKGNYMVHDVSDVEIKKALFDIDSNKAPGPDGFSSEFLRILGKLLLMRGYHSKRGPGKCAFKVDIHKAFDSVEWRFLKTCLKHFGFHDVMIRWIMECVTTTSFSINVNGDMHGFYKGKRGLRQGDPLSPYLFTLIMEVLNLLIKRHVSYGSVAVLKKALDDFDKCLGLLPSLTKSFVFFSNVSENSKARILKVMPMNVGNLPIRLEKLSLILCWETQLIQSVVNSMQVYWASMFIFPISITNDIERLMRDFLWNFGEFKRGKAKIKWNDVRRPKVEGGLDSLWVKLIHLFKLKGRSFWDIPEKEGSSWSWKKILKTRGRIRDHIFHRIGDGSITSLWFDNWHPICPLSDFISKRKIHYAGFSLSAKVLDVIVNGSWKWPVCLANEFEGLLVIDPPPIINGKLDKILWKSNSGKLLEFSVSNVYDDLRRRSLLVP
ncbi:putative reverse transcriptase domain-containing protein [Tanacetum coccineum]